MNHSVQSARNDLAIASMVLGISSLIGFGALTGIPAIVLGTMSLKNPTNRGMGITGIITGIVSTVLTLLAILFLGLVIVLGLLMMSAGDQPGDHGFTPDSSDSYSNQREA